MRRELLDLIRKAGVEGDFGWPDVLVVYNYAPVPPVRGAGSRALWNRGFNLVILRDGRPTHFVKCRPRDDEVLAWESTIRNCLAGRRIGGLSVAGVSVASSGRLTVQAGAFLQGQHLGKIVVGQTTAAYLSTIRLILEGAAQLSRQAVAACVLDAGPPLLSVADAAAPYLDQVALLANLDAGQRAAMHSTLRAAGEVPSRPQHGDFWFQNLLSVDGDIWAIDFDSYGSLRIPLFDDLTLMLGTLALRARSPETAIDVFFSGSPEATDCRAFLRERARAEGVAEEAMNGLLVHYLVNMASTVHRRGGIGFATPHIAAARRAAELLASGHALLGPNAQSAPRG